LQGMHGRLHAHSFGAPPPPPPPPPPQAGLYSHVSTISIMFCLYAESKPATSTPAPLQAGLSSDDVLAATSTHDVLRRMEPSVFGRLRAWGLFWGQRLRTRVNGAARATAGAHGGAMYALRDLISREPAGSSRHWK
jgi:hypothetical protein